MTEGATPRSVPEGCESDWDAKGFAQKLVPGCWPGADVGALRVHAGRYRELAMALDRIGAEIHAARTDADVGAGIFHDRFDSGLRRLVDTDDGVMGVGHRLLVMADQVDRYADLVVQTRQQMAVIAALTDRDMRRGELLAALGDESARVLPAAAGRMALTAAGEEFIDRADRAGHHDAPPPAAPSGMMPFLSLGALGGAAALGGMHANGHIDDDPSAAPGASAADLTWLRRRAAQLHAGIDSGVAGWLRTAVGVGVSARGRRVVVVATNDPQPYQRRGMNLGDEEGLAADGGPAELAVVGHMTRTGIRPLAVATTEPMDPTTIAALRIADVVALAPNVS